MEKDNQKSDGLNFVSVLFLIFLTLKLAGLGIISTWSWIWIFSPIWISWGIVFFVYLIMDLKNKK